MSSRPGPELRPESGAAAAPPDGDLEAMLALLEGERARAARALEPDPRFMYGVWGAAWLIGFLALWLHGTDGTPHLGPWVAGIVFAACMAGAMAVMGIHLYRRFSGVRGPAATAGAMIGWSWTLSFAALTLIMFGVHRSGATDEQMGLLWSVLSGLVVGILYLSSGAFLRDRVQYGFGLWILVASSAGAVTGFPGVLLVMSLGGGGGFLAAAAFFAVRHRLRTRARP